MMEEGLNRRQRPETVKDWHRPVKKKDRQHLAVLPVNLAGLERQLHK
jgi:hypothetical protein